MLNENRFLGTFRGHNTRTTRPRPLLGWLWQVSLAGLVNFRVAFGNYRNGHRPAAKSPSPSLFM